jgi:hypothetical protein
MELLLFADCSSRSSCCIGLVVIGVAVFLLTPLTLTLKTTIPRRQRHMRLTPSSAKDCFARMAVLDAAAHGGAPAPASDVGLPKYFYHSGDVSILAGVHQQLEQRMSRDLHAEEACGPFEPHVVEDRQSHVCVVCDADSSEAGKVLCCRLLRTLSCGR